jgi:hypothetical protein
VKRGIDPMRATSAALALLVGVAACGRPGHEESEARRRAWSTGRAAAAEPSRRFASATHLAYAYVGVTTPRRTFDGRAARVRCRVCHDTLQPKPEREMATRVPGFHGRVKLVHGGQTCRTCHNPPRFEDFRLGSGKTLPYAQVIELCGQCHSRQRADYAKGIHGGMTGYWDLDRGPRDRNACVDCHNPHRPAIGQVLPLPGPRFRRPPAQAANDAPAARGEGER